MPSKECYMCGNPVPAKEAESSERIARKVSKDLKREIRPRYFCSGACVEAKYLG